MDDCNVDENHLVSNSNCKDCNSIIPPKKLQGMTNYVDDTISQFTFRIEQVN